MDVDSNLSEKKVKKKLKLKKILIWINGGNVDETFYCSINKTINSLRRLKDKILSYINMNTNIDKVKIYNYKGIEIDDADIEYLKSNQILYVSLNSIEFFF